jgi:hypothetical protein
MSQVTFDSVGRPILPALPILPGATIVQTFDSVTKGFTAPSGPDDPTLSWSALLTPQITAAFTAAGKTPPTFINTAVDGQTSAALIADINNQIISRAPTDIFMYGTTNDATGSGSDWTIYAHYLTILTTVWGSLPACKFHCFSLGFHGSEKPQIGAGSHDGDMLGRNSALWRACLQYPGLCEFIDLRNAVYQWEKQYNTTPVTSGLLSQDGIHPAKAAVTGAPNGGVGIMSNAAFAALTLQLS